MSRSDAKALSLNPLSLSLSSLKIDIVAGSKNSTSPSSPPFSYEHKLQPSIPSPSLFFPSPASIRRK